MGNSWFQFKEFKVNQERSAMKVGVDSVILGSASSFYSPKVILDIGTGTGLLAFMAEQRTNAKIIAVEIDEDSYFQCLENIKLNNKEEKIIVHHISFQDFCRQSDLKFDHIISNPPYFINSTKPNSRSNYVAKHSSFLSFDELLSGVSKLLKQNGIFSVIIPFDNYDSFIKIAKKIKLYIFKELLIYPKVSKEPNRIIIELKKQKSHKIREVLNVRDSESGFYTEEYIQLTKDFYMNLADK